jgi:hypothetical protein
MRIKYASMVILLGFLSTSAKVNLAFIKVGGGYPMGIINELNSSFESAYAQAQSTFGSSGTTSLTKTNGGYFSTNIGFGFYDSTDMANRNVFGFAAGYSYTGTGEAKYLDNFTIQNQNYTLSVSGKYSINEFRVMPILFKLNESFEGFGGGVGIEYALVNYHQKSTTNIPNSLFVLPDMAHKSSGLTWCAWLYGQLNFIGVEIALSGVNLFSIGAFITMG